ncbi:MAG: (2Fe-2S)-binding protein [Euryarchaeota archaeon]|nr:(2Fe-2S)-binding protein [Euryarchaeota archaeon]
MSDNPKEHIIICRCNGVTLKDIEDLIDEGITNIEEIKRQTHIGMGPCQGRTCIPMVASIIARKTGQRIEDIKIPATRIPVRPVSMGILVGDNDE